MNDKAKAYNKSICSSNKYLEFRGAVSVPLKSRFNKADFTALDLLFSEHIHIRFFDPERSIMERIRQSNIFQALCQCVGCDFLDIPPCPGGWEDFVIELTSLLSAHKYILLYAKITIDADGNIIPGTGKCFSREPDMAYSDEDLRFLDHEDTYLMENAVLVSDLPSTARPTLPDILSHLPAEITVDIVEAIMDKPKDVFEEYLASIEKPAWVAEEVAKQKPKTKPRNKKPDPLDLSINMKRPSMEDVDFGDLPF